MNCEQCRVRLDRYILGKLTPDQVEDLQGHLVDCPDCQEQLEWAREALQDPAGQEQELKRHQTSVLLERDRRRQLNRSESGLMRMIKWIVIGCCFALVVVGVKMRSDKFQQDFPSYHEEAATLTVTEMITASLDLNPVEVEQFFPIYEQTRRDLRTIKREQELNEVRIDNLIDAEDSEQVSELIGNRQVFQQQLLDRKQQFYRETAELLGSERAQSLQLIEDRLWN